MEKNAIIFYINAHFRSYVHKIITEVKKVAYSERELLARIIQCEAGGERRQPE